MPRDAKLVKSLLKSMEVENYEPRLYSELASKSSIDFDDVKLAIQIEETEQDTVAEVYSRAWCADSTGLGHVNQS
ncbi:Transcription initiation factor TFIID subunit [Arachis hypogaea]|nr:Transcription initiation factor TFIID subunit [Arachis hypogaea]